MNNDSNNSSQLRLELSERLKEKKIVTEFYYHIPTQQIKIGLNHKYQPINAIFKVNVDDWSKNKSQIYKILKPKGVDKEDIELIATTLDNNWEKIYEIVQNNNSNVSVVVSDPCDLYDQIKNNKSDSYKDQQNHQQGQYSQRDIQIFSVLEIKKISEGPAKVIGRIVGRSTNFRVISQTTWNCRDSECTNSGLSIYDPPLLNPLPQLDNTRGTDPSCFKCKKFGMLDVHYEYRNAKIIQLDDIDTIDEKFDRLEVILYDDASNNISDGEIVEIEGIIHTQRRISGGFNKSNKMVNILHTDKKINYKNKREIKLSKKDIEIFYKWKKICIESYKKELEVINKYKDISKENRPEWVKKIKPMTFDQRITAMFAPNVYGHADKKIGIIRSLVGGSKTKNGTDNGRRGRIHTLMIGDPGTAKTTLAAESIKLDQNSRIVDATGASGKSLVGIVDKENDSLMVKYGVVVAAKNSHIVINEAGSMSHEDQWHLIGIAEEGSTSLDKWGEHISIDAPTTLILTANPIGTKWESSKMSKNQMVVIRQNLLDRIDQIYGFFDTQTEIEMEEFVNEMDKNTSRKPHNYNFLTKYIQYAKTIEPKLTEITKYRLDRFWIKAKLKGMAANRSFFSIKRIAEAQAKLNLSKEVDDIIAIRTIESLQLMYIQYGTTIEQIRNPRDLTVEVFYTILKENNGIDHSVKEICKKASETNNQVKGYLKNKWEISHNKELREIIDILKQKENIKIINLKPLILVYSNEISPNHTESKTYNNDSLSDLSDPYDQSSNNILEEKENNNNSYQLNSQSYRSYGSYSKEELSTKNDKLVNISNKKKGLSYEMTKEQFDSWIGNEK